MNKELRNYLDTEIELSKYKILTISRSGNLTPSKIKLIQMEEDFTNIDFEKIDFIDIADLASAISIYRLSPYLFYETYKVDVPSIMSKINNFQDVVAVTALKFKNEKIEEVNSLQNDFFFNLSVKRFAKYYDNDIDKARAVTENYSVEQMHSIEGVYIEKLRARLQAMIYSLGLSLEEVAKRSDIESLNCFKYYNNSLEHLSKKSLTWGKNDTFDKIQKLEVKAPKKFEISLPKNFSIGNVVNFGNNKRALFSIETDIKHVGNEKISLLYFEIFKDGKNISRLFNNFFSNISVDGQYFKSISIKPFKKLSKDDRLLVDKYFISNGKLKSIHTDIDKESYFCVSPSRREDEIFHLLSKEINNCKRYINDECL